MKVIQTVKDKGLAEIYQSMGNKFALARYTDKPDTVEKITPFVLCRDFLSDAYAYTLAKKPFGLYGFHWDGTKEKPEWSAILLCVAFPNQKAKECFYAHLPMLHKIEKDNKLDLTKASDVDGETLMVVTEGDKAWLANGMKFTLYTLLLRVMCYDFNPGKDWVSAFIKLKASDAAYVASVHKTVWEKVLTDLSSIDTKEFLGFDLSSPKTTMGACHHNSGFISIFGQHTEISPTTVKQNAHYQLMKERGFKMATN